MVFIFIFVQNVVCNFNKVIFRKLFVGSIQIIRVPLTRGGICDRVSIYHIRGITHMTTLFFNLIFVLGQFLVGKKIPFPEQIWAINFLNFTPIVFFFEK
jgi:hypothetical protein